jgi:hypothetical protein
MYRLLRDIEHAVAYVDVGEEWEDDDERTTVMPQAVALIAGTSALFGERDQVTAASEASWRPLDKEARWVTAVTAETVWTRLFRSDIAGQANRWHM